MNRLSVSRFRFLASFFHKKQFSFLLLFPGKSKGCSIAELAAHPPINPIVSEFKFWRSLSKVTLITTLDGVLKDIQMYTNEFVFV